MKISSVNEVSKVSIYIYIYIYREREREREREGERETETHFYVVRIITRMLIKMTFYFNTKSIKDALQ